ncbi:MAG: nucleoside monophosphate kinase [Bryobacteraceae bacterium]|nr:nucleoside monophosphate kinase [Bryobacteraceae bacterium]
MTRQLLPLLLAACSCLGPAQSRDRQGAEQEASSRPVIVLIGPAGAGKSTQAEFLKKKYGFAVISAEQLIEADPALLARSKQPEIHGVDPRTDPALNKIFAKVIEKTDTSKGLVLDGYPATKDHADFLAARAKERGLSRHLVIHLLIPDDAARQRIKDRIPAKVEQALKDYHRELDFVKLYYPDADIHEIDGTATPDAVSKAIAALVDARLKSAPKGAAK